MTTFPRVVPLFPVNPAYGTNCLVCGLPVFTPGWAVYDPLTLLGAVHLNHLEMP